MDSKCKITYFLDREADEYTYLSDKFRPTKALLIVMFLRRLIYQQTEVFLKHSLGNQRQMDLKWSFVSYKLLCVWWDFQILTLMRFGSM